MRILFICSGTFNSRPSPIIKAQGISLEKKGLIIDYFTIRIRGFEGYLTTAFKLRRFLKERKYNVLHAHYGLSAIVALIARRNEKLVVSFMGDDLLGSRTKYGERKTLSILMAKINKLLAGLFYDYCIVKSEEMKNRLDVMKMEVIPNGVDTSVFHPLDKKEARKKLGLPDSKKIALFVSDPSRPEKNFYLAENAINLLEEPVIELLQVSNITHSDLVYYYNAVDVLLLTSFHEGSPNVIKEAMACNCPIVSTKVGDIEWIMGNAGGCYLGPFDSKGFASKISEALKFSKAMGETNGRQRIMDLGINSETIAGRIIKVYEKVKS